MNWYKKLVKVIEYSVTYLLIVMLAMMVIITLVEVVRRYFFGLAFPWSGELVRYLLVWVTFLGSSLAFNKGSLVSFDLLLNSLSIKLKVILELIINTICTGFVVYLFGKAVDYTFSPAIVNQYSPTLGISMKMIYFSMPLGFGIMAFFGLNKFPEIFNKLKKEVFKTK